MQLLKYTFLQVLSLSICKPQISITKRLLEQLSAKGQPKGM